MNMNIYKFVDINLDPVYQMIVELHEGDSCRIDKIQISRQKFYEIESETEHVPFRDMLSCYRYVSDILVKQVSE